MCMVIHSMASGLTIRLMATALPSMSKTEANTWVSFSTTNNTAWGRKLGKTVPGKSESTNPTSNTGSARSTGRMGVSTQATFRKTTLKAKGSRPGQMVGSSTAVGSKTK